MELMVGLNLGCVTRLKKTWEVSNLLKKQIISFSYINPGSPKECSVNIWEFNKINKHLSKLFTL